jgi:uncharacterized protein (DUF58 family)
MNEGEMRLLQTEIAFWALLILSQVATGWYSLVLSVMSLVLLIGGWILDRALYPREPSEGFWSRVWKR